MSSIEAEALLTKEGVFIHEQTADGEDDVLRTGTIYIWKKRDGIFLEWKQSTDVENKNKETEWTMVPDTVSYKNGSDKVSDCVVVQKKKTQHHVYVINFDIKDMKCFKTSKPSGGWKHLTFIMRCGTTYPALHFHEGGTRKIINELHKHLSINRSLQDVNLYLVREHDPQALSKSFDELNLFEKDQAGDIITKFINDPVTTTIGGFSKVTNFFRDAALFFPPDDDGSMTTSLAMEEDNATELDIKPLEETGFEMITTNKTMNIQLPPRPSVKRADPVTSEQWSSFMNIEGKIMDIDAVKEAIFKGGIDPSIRNEIWKFLLGYYKWNSTYKSRMEQRKQKVDDYFRMKLQWKSISDDQQLRFTELRDRKSLIDKDVMRTDRTHNFFEGENNPNISVLYDILLTHCMYDFDLGYVQGMSDLLAPILVVLENEVDAFWCFAGFIQMMGRNFEKDQQAMKNQLAQLQMLVNFVDPELANYLESHESINMYFCFRWLLIIFKREFSFPDIMRLWEVIWTAKPCKNFHLLLCLAIFDSAKTTLIENNFGFNEILKYVNDLSCNIDVNEILCTAEAIYHQLIDCRDLPSTIHNILCLSMSSQDASPFQPFNPSHFDASVANANETTPTTGRSSNQSSPERTVAATSQLLQCHNGGDSVMLHRSDNTAAAAAGELTTPDDSSIEILSEHHDLIL